MVWTGGVTLDKDWGSCHLDLDASFSERCLLWTGGVGFLWTGGVYSFAHIFPSTAATGLKLCVHILKACIQVCAKDECIWSTFTHQVTPSEPHISSCTLPCALPTTQLCLAHSGLHADTISSEKGKKCFSSGRKWTKKRPKRHFWLVNRKILQNNELFGCTVFCIFVFGPNGSFSYFMKNRLLV